VLPSRNPGVKPWDNLSTEEVQELLARPTSHTYYPGQEHLPSSAAPPINGRSFSITAPVERPDARAEGVLVAQGEFSYECDLRGVPSRRQGRQTKGSC
jgi:hypothetical protein